MDIHVDPDHDRSVFTVLGTPDQLAVGLVAGARVAVERINLRTQAGVHPRIGALDVLPIVPLDDLDIPGGGTATDAIRLVERIAPALGALGVPVIRYGIGTGAPRTALLRPAQGASEALAARLASGEQPVIAGPRELHPRAGALLLGARTVLIAFNVELGSRQLDSARHISAVVRETGGGLPGVRTLAFPLPSRGTVQVSCNIERWREAGPAEVLERVADLAAVLEVPVVRAELVGLAPREALHDLRIACRRNRIRLSASSEPVIEIKTRLARDRAARK